MGLIPFVNASRKHWTPSKYLVVCSQAAQAQDHRKKNSNKLCLQGPPRQNKSTGSCSEGSNQQKNCKGINLKKEQG